MKRFGVFLILSATVLTSAGCNTFLGMGRDVEGLGKGLQNIGYGTGWKGDKPSPYQAPAPSDTAPAKKP